MDEGVRDDHQVSAPQTSSSENESPICHICELCGAFSGLKICGACKDVWYCCKEHQRSHWGEHRTLCKLSRETLRAKTVSTTVANREGVNSNCGQDLANNGSSIKPISGDCAHVQADPLTHSQARGVGGQGGKSDEATGSASGTTLSTEGSTTTHCVRGVDSDASGAVLSSSASDGQVAPVLNPKVKHKTTKSPAAGEKTVMTRNKCSPENVSSTSGSNPKDRKKSGAKKASKRSQEQKAEPTPPDSERTTKDLAGYVVKCLTEYGICVLDKFLGEARGDAIYKEVLTLHADGTAFTDGQVISGQGPKQTIRRDQITWVERGEDGRDETSYLMSKLDTLMMACNEGLCGCELGGRTKAMVACYPGNGAFYLRHVDNPNEDGRLITCIYYLNKDWDTKKDGGMLRIFPESIKNAWVADIEPQFDRLLFFWSNRRNPHEVQAAHKKRFAITVWYFDKEERETALSRYQQSACLKAPTNARILSMTPLRSDPM